MGVRRSAGRPRCSLGSEDSHGVDHGGVGGLAGGGGEATASSEM